MCVVLIVISLLFPTPNWLRKKWSLSYKWRSGMSVTGKLSPHINSLFEHCNQVVDWQRVYRSISSYNYNLCKDISQSMIYIYFLYILCHISLSVTDLDSRTVQIFVTSVHFQSLTRLGLVWCWVLKEQLQFVHPRISITWLSWIKTL